MWIKSDVAKRAIRARVNIHWPLYRDKYVFKVPSLRNVAATAPYFHDGSVDILEGAIITMAQLQLGLNLTLAEATKIASFLNSLTGMYRGRAVGSE